MSDPHIPTCSPYPPVGLAPFAERWRTETVWALAQSILADAAFDRMPILADALEDAGCDDLLLLNHCRYCETHLASCWALQAIFTGDDPQTAAHERWRISQAVAEAIQQGHPDDPNVVPGRKMPSLTAKEPHSTYILRAAVLSLLALFVWGVVRAVFQF